MIMASIRVAKNRFTELARQVEAGETIVVTRNGRPILDLVPHRPQSGLRLEAIDAFKARHGINSIVLDIAADFDAPLAEDFLISPLPYD
jgi:prevent-host-death family protein